MNGVTQANITWPCRSRIVSLDLRAMRIGEDRVVTGADFVKYINGLEYCLKNSM